MTLMPEFLFIPGERRHIRAAMAAWQHSAGGSDSDSSADRRKGRRRAAAVAPRAASPQRLGRKRKQPPLHPPAAEDALSASLYFEHAPSGCPAGPPAGGAPDLLAAGKSGSGSGPSSNDTSPRRMSSCTGRCGCGRKASQQLCGCRCTAEWVGVDAAAAACLDLAEGLHGLPQLQERDCSRASGSESASRSDSSQSAASSPESLTAPLQALLVEVRGRLDAQPDALISTMIPVS